MYYIPQLSNSSCGMACLKMLLAIVQKDERYLYLSEEEEHGQYNYQDLLLIAQRYDVTLFGAQINDKDDLRHFDKFPVILTVSGPNDTSHAVLVSQRKGKKVKVHDPATGIKWQKIDSLIQIWDGTLLAVNDFQKHPYPYNVIDSKDPKGMVISSILQVFTAVFIAVATFFIKPDGNIILPLVFAGLSIASEILLRFTLLKRMQRFDKYLRRFLPYVRSRDYFEFYKRGQEYKKCSLSSGLNLLFSLLIVILIITISAINSLDYLILIFASLLAAYLDVFFFSPYKNNLGKEIYQEECELRGASDVEGVEMKVKAMEVKAYRYAYMEFAKKGVVALFMFVASLALSVAEKSFSIPNIIFYTCLSLLLYQSLTPLFGYDQRLEENLLCKARVNNIVHQDEIDRKHK